ncbi:neuromedin-U receptor 2-like [Oppia nitens]|uniref:neuromedin-U receptor 2-like n=1 Tax=Oppia nitens TaxID=1686743 RepID=UPI0023DC2CE1|nr:neuromedin-U receptor 2-like [Oppia nitens]
MNETKNLEYIATILGPQRSLSLSWLIPLTVVYIIILIFGVLGNVVTILVILRFRYMQTITNLYLCNLAITDLITLICGMPLELYTLWHQYPFSLGVTICRLKSLVPESTANASVLTLVTFTLERYMAICGSPKVPNSQSLFNTKDEMSRIKRIAIRNIVIIWIFSLIGAIPLSLFTQINYLFVDSKPLYESAWCGLPFNQPNLHWETIMLSSTIIFFLIPLTIISLLYYRIARKLKRATKLDPLNHPDLHLADHRTSRKIMQSRKIVIRMLVCIVIVFSLCWCPFHAQRLLFLYISLYSTWTNTLRQVNQVLFLLAGCLYYLNSSLNPLIYSVLSTRFRAAFILYVNGCCAVNTSQTPSATNSRVRNKASGSKSNSNNNNSVVGGGGQPMTQTVAKHCDNNGVSTKVHWSKNPAFLDK